MFYNVLTALRTVSNTYVQVARAQSCANHVQHIACLSHVTCRMPRGPKGQLSSRLGFVHPLQDVALHQCLPLSSVCCLPNPGGSLLLCYATKFDRFEILQILAVCHWRKPLTDAGGNETGENGRDPQRRAPEIPHTKARKFKSRPTHEPAVQHRWQDLAGEVGVHTTTPRVAPIST